VLAKPSFARRRSYGSIAAEKEHCVSARERAIGEAARLDLASADFLEREFEIWDLLRSELPVAKTGRAPMAQGATTGWVVTRYDDCADVLRRPEEFSSSIGIYPVRPWIPQAIDPPAHTAYRRILNPWFTAEAMARLEPHLAQYAGELLDKMLAKDEFDFVADFADPFPTVIFCELIGFPLADYPQIMDWKNVLMHANDGHSRGRALALAKGKALGIDVSDEKRITAEQWMQIRAVVGLEIYGYLKKLLDERRRVPADDLITRLLAAKYEGERPLTQEELEDTLFLLFMAGLDTVASVLGLVVKGFAEDPAKRREFLALMDDEARVGPALEELVRVHAIVTMPRRATRAIAFRSERFGENEIVACPSPAANRDPDQFPAPHEIRFDRAPNRHLGFGLGPHRCLGIHLARRELRIALQAFHRRLPDYRLHPARKPELFGGMKGVASLWLRKA
jgi:cytochrome P450